MLFRYFFTKDHRQRSKLPDTALNLEIDDQVSFTILVGLYIF